MIIKKMLMTIRRKPNIMKYSIIDPKIKNNKKSNKETIIKNPTDRKIFIIFYGWIDY